MLGICAPLKGMPSLDEYEMCELLRYTKQRMVLQEKEECTTTAAEPWRFRTFCRSQTSPLRPRHENVTKIYRSARQKRPTTSSRRVQRLAWLGISIVTRLAGCAVPASRMNKIAGARILRLISRTVNAGVGDQQPGKLGGGGLPSTNGHGHTLNLLSSLRDLREQSI